HGDGAARGFGGAVALGEDRPEDGDGSLEHLDGHRAACIGEQSQAAQVVGADRGHVQEPPVEGGHAFMWVHFSSWMSRRISLRSGLRTITTFPPARSTARTGRHETWKIGRMKQVES